MNSICATVILELKLSLGGKTLKSRASTPALLILHKRPTPAVVTPTHPSLALIPKYMLFLLINLSIYLSINQLINLLINK